MGSVGGGVWKRRVSGVGEKEVKGVGGEECDEGETCVGGEECDEGEEDDWVGVVGGACVVEDGGIWGDAEW